MERAARRRAVGEPPPDTGAERRTNIVAGASLIVGTLMGTIGVGYFVYGRRQHEGAPLFAGAALVAMPLLVGNVWAMLAIGVALMAMPYFLRE